MERKHWLRVLLGIVVTGLVLSAVFYSQNSTNSVATEFARSPAEPDNGGDQQHRLPGGLPADATPVVESPVQESGAPLDASQSRSPFKRLPEPVFIGNATALSTEALQRAESGDASSAYYVFRLLDACRTADSDSTTDSDYLLLSGCSELPEELLQRRLEFLDRAARLGNTNAQLDYGAYFGEPFADVEYLMKNPEKFDAFKADVQRFLNSAAKSRSVDALLRLGNLYEDGLLVKQDRIQAYAYYWAVDRSGLYPLAGLNLVRMSQGMTQQEALEATRRGQVLLEHCCQQGGD